MPCHNPIGSFRDPEGNLIPSSCKSWGCPDCSKVKKNKLLDRANRGFNHLQKGGRRIRAVTLTLGPGSDNKLMGKYIARFRSWLAKPRLHKKKMRSFRGINYFWTKEFTEEGRLHIHMLIDTYIPIGILKKAWKWATYGTSYIVFITKIYNEIYNAAGYMTKYMEKEISQCDQFRKGERRFGFSRSWNTPFLLDSYRYYFRYLPVNIKEYTFEYNPTPTISFFTYCLSKYKYLPK